MLASRRRTASSLVAAVVLAVTMSACTDDPGAAEPGHGNPNASSPQSSAPTTSASPADVASKKALAAYEGMWADFVAAGRTSDWESKRLGDHATGLALTNMSRALYADKKNKLITKGEPVLHPEVESVEPRSNPVKVVVTDCGDSSNWLKYHAKTGKQMKGSPGGQRRINAIVEKQSDGRWKVTDYGVHEVGSC